MIGPFLVAERQICKDAKTDRRAGTVFQLGIIHLSTDSIHTVKPLEVDIPKGQADRCDRCVRLWQDDDGAGKPGTGTAGGDRAEERLPAHVKDVSGGGHFPCEADRCRHPLESMFVPQ